MAQYKQSIRIPASPDEIFDFVANTRNLPKYLPIIRKAQSRGHDRVQVQGQMEGHPYTVDGYLHVDRENYRLEWGADQENYSGHLKIQPQDDLSLVTVHIHFQPKPSSERDQFTDEEIQQSLVDALESIRNEVTGEGELDEEDLAFPDGQSNDLSPSVV
jgi:hypothetical protein